MYPHFAPVPNHDGDATNRSVIGAHITTPNTKNDTLLGDPQTLMGKHLVMDIRDEPDDRATSPQRERCHRMEHAGQQPVRTALRGSGGRDRKQHEQRCERSDEDMLEHVGGEEPTLRETAEG